MKSEIDKAYKEMIQCCEDRIDCNGCKYNQPTPLGMSICNIILHVNLSVRKEEENSSRPFIQGHTYVVDEALFIDRMYNGDILAYKDTMNGRFWIKDVMGLKFTIYNEGDGDRSKKIVGRSGFTWTISRTWCRDITKDIRG